MRFEFTQTQICDPKIFANKLKVKFGTYKHFFKILVLRNSWHNFFSVRKLFHQNFCYIKTIWISNKSFSFSKTEKDTLCCCGLPFFKHSRFTAIANSPPSAVTWSWKTDTKVLPTNAFGEIEFVGYDEIQRKVKITGLKWTNMIDCIAN